MCGDTLVNGTSMRCSTKNEKAGPPARSKARVACARGPNSVRVTALSRSPTTESVKAAARYAPYPAMIAINITPLTSIHRRIASQGAIQQRECHRVPGREGTLNASVSNELQKRVSCMKVCRVGSVGVEKVVRFYIPLIRPGWV